MAKLECPGNRKMTDLSAFQDSGIDFTSSNDIEGRLDLDVSSTSSFEQITITPQGVSVVGVPVRLIESVWPNLDKDAVSNWTGVVSTLDDVMAAPDRIAVGEDVNAAIRLARQAGYTGVAERLGHLLSLDGDTDIDEEPLNAASACSFVNFLMAHPELRTPLFGVTPNGYIQADWRSTVGTIGLVAAFLPSGLIKFSAVGDSAHGKLSGELSPPRMWRSIRDICGDDVVVGDG